MPRFRGEGEELDGRLFAPLRPLRRKCGLPSTGRKMRSNPELVTMSDDELQDDTAGRMGRTSRSRRAR